MVHSKSKVNSRSLEDIRHTFLVHLPELRQQYSIKALGVFGSYVKGQQRRNSDLDLLVEYEEAPTFFQFVRLERRLSELLGVKVDLVMKSALKPSIREDILKEVVPVEP